jgi:hypothetical protein
MLFRYIFLTLIVALVACSDKVSQDADPSNGGDGDIIVVPGENDPSVNPSDDDNSIIHPKKGDVVVFNWQQTLPWYYESSEHHYGFDKDPLSQVEGYAENGKFVYLSVLKGQNANVILKVDPNARDVIKFNTVDEKFSVVSTISTGSQLCAAGVCETTLSLPVGTYAIYYGDVDKERYLKVVEYIQRTVPASYFQFDGDTPCIDVGCYSFEGVKSSFDKVFGQAVLINGFKQVDPKDYGFEQIMTVDMTDPIKNDFFTDVLLNLYDKFYPGYKDAYHFFVDKVEGSEDANGDKQTLADIYVDEWNSYVKCFNANSCTYTSEQIAELKQNYSVYTTNKATYLNANEVLYGNRYIFALNVTRFMWRLKENNDQTGNIPISNYSELVPLFYKYNGGPMEMYLKSLTSACDDGAVGLSPKKVRVLLVDKNIDENTANITITDMDGKKVSFNPECDYIYTDEMTHVPGTVSVTESGYGSAAQITSSMKNENGVVDGGLVWSGKQEGEASQNTLLHEIGHTLGLTDAFINYVDGTVPFFEKIGCYNETYDVVPCSNVYTEIDAYHAGWTTQEANLMNYRIPSGPRLRYRETPVVKTGTNRRLRDDEENIIYENQWECVQNKECHKKK